jgi:hypothetical protein
MPHYVYILQSELDGTITLDLQKISMKGFIVITRAAPNTPKPSGPGNWFVMKSILTDQVLSKGKKKSKIAKAKILSRI